MNWIKDTQTSSSLYLFPVSHLKKSLRKFIAEALSYVCESLRKQTVMIDYSRNRYCICFIQYGGYLFRIP